MRRMLLVAVFLLWCGGLSSLAHADTKAEARRYFSRGMRAISQGDVQEGIALLLRAYAIRPHPNVLFNVASAYAQAQDLDRAVTYFNQYLESNPEDEARVERIVADLVDRARLRRDVDDGMRAIRQGRFLEGIAKLEVAYAERPHPNLLYNIARAYEDANQLARAIALYQRYAELSPPDKDAISARVATLERRMTSGLADATDFAADPSSPRPAAHFMFPLDPLIRQLSDIALGRAPYSSQTTRPIADTPLATAPTSSVAEPPLALGEKQSSGYEDVVVSAARREQSPLDAPNAVTILTDEDIRLSGAQTIPELLRRVPGMDVMSMSRADDNVAMRGFNRRLANRLLVLVDGRSIYQDFLGVVLWRMLDIDLSEIERIEVVRGPGSAIYGAYAYTGIVNIITKRPAGTGTTQARIGLGNGRTIDAHVGHASRSGPWGIRMGAGFAEANKYELEFGERVDYVASTDEPNLSYRRARASGLLEYTWPGKGRAFLSAGMNTGVQELYGTSFLRNQHLDGLVAHTEFGIFEGWFSLHGFWNGLRMKSAPEYFPTGLTPLTSTLRADLFSIEPVLRPAFELLGKHLAVVGVDFRHTFVEWNYLRDIVLDDQIAFFLQDSWAPSESWTILVSGRLDHHPLFGLLGSPRAALIYKPTEQSAIRASIGTAFRQPTQAETHVALSANSPVAGVAVSLFGGEAALKPERVLTLDLGFLLQSDIGEFEAVGYVNRVDNLIVRGPLVPVSVGASFDARVGAFVGATSTFTNETSVYLAPGAELSARIYPVDGVDIGASYAFQMIVNQDTGERFTESPMHKASLWTALRSEWGIDFGLSAHYVSSQDWIEPTIDTRSATGLDESAKHLPGSVLLMGRLGVRLVEDRLEIGLVGTNLTDIGNARHREHPFANRLESRVLTTITGKL